MADLGHDVLVASEPPQERESESDMSKRESVMRKVSALLAKAASTTYEPERAALLAKADEMMTAHAIEEFELAQARPAQEREQPELRWVTLFSTEVQHEISWELRMLFRSLAKHVGAKVANTKYDNGNCLAHVVGYRMDLDYLETLYINLQMHFLRTATPKVEADRSEMDNFAAMWEAGMEWPEIFRAFGWEWLHNGKNFPVGPTVTKVHKLRRAYAEMCKNEGREPVKGVRGKTYFESFLTGYVTQITRRLAEMSNNREAAGFGLVLAGREDDLKEAMYNAYPDMRPHPKTCECDDCHWLKCHDRSCTRTRCVEARKPVKMGRVRAYKPPKQDHRAYTRGAAAAKTADLGGAKVAGRRETLN